jgi:hypothetical protein
MSEPHRHQSRSEDGLGAGQAVHLAVDGERGPIRLFAVVLDYALHASAIRQGQVYDSWELAGDGSPGYTWSNRNPLAAIGLYPDRRFDYISSAWPRRGGAGIPSTAYCSGSVLRPRARYLITTG